MARKSESFVCTDCGAEHARWAGQCSQCSAWNTVSEFRQSKAGPRTSKRSGYAGESAASVQSLSEIDLRESPRVSTGSSEFDRVLGGGLVAGSAVLLGGHPGAGKSTLLLQTACRLAGSMQVLYVTGEESLQQIALRAKRLQLPVDALKIFSNTDLDTILETAERSRPALLIIDSIQVLAASEVQSVPGSVSQVRECAAALTRYAKRTGTIVLIVGHVTKDGTLAGPKVLEHIIDASIMLESGSDHRYRILRVHKNRFGAVNELGVFAMVESGLRDVRNPSALFLSHGGENTGGAAVTALWEGSRPLLVELQALVDTACGGPPRRLAVGFDPQRISLLLAVLNRHAGLQLGDQDVYVNIVGGLRVTEPAADLAMLAALVSSFRNRPIDRKTIFFGEVGLAGEVRPVVNGQDRIREAAKHGFKRILLPAANLPSTPPKDIELVSVASVSEFPDQI